MRTYVAVLIAALVALSTPADARRHVHARQAPPVVSLFGGMFGGGSGLVSSARRYIGTNPTGRRRLWCGAFMAMIAPSAASHINNPNLAMNWASLPRTSPHVGAIAVMARRGGGHVGIVSGFDASGNPTIISGNAGGGIVREHTYPRGRIRAWVSP